MYYGGVKMNNHNVDVGEILDRLDWKKQVTKVYKCFKFHEVKKKKKNKHCLRIHTNVVIYEIKQRNNKNIFRVVHGRGCGSLNQTIAVAHRELLKASSVLLTNLTGDFMNVFYAS